MELCITIPANNEVLTLTETIENIEKKLKAEIPFNILVDNDHSDDNTLKLLGNLAFRLSNLKYVSNDWDRGVGNVIGYGLSIWQGDIVALCIADGSYSPKEILLFYKKIRVDGNDCIFGSRFIKSG